MTVRSRARSTATVLVAALTSTLTTLVCSPAAAMTVTRPQPEPTTAHASPAASPLSGPGTHVRLHGGAPGLPGELSGLSWLVADADTGDVLAARDAHRKLPPASTLKTLFAVTTIPHLPATRTHRVTEAELAEVAPGSSRVGVVAGHTYRVSDLWHGVFLSSGNDAVHVLAEMNGGWHHTAEAMQAKAAQLGADDTRVVSPDGYDEPGQVSSAYDLAVFAHAGLHIPEFAEYCSTATADFPGNGGRTFQIQNTNRLLTGAGGVSRYPGVVGVKNGYTSHAGNTLIAAARHGGHTVLVTVMNPQSGESQAVYREAKRLLDWGADADGRVRPVGSLLPPGAQAPAAAHAGHTGHTGHTGQAGRAAQHTGQAGHTRKSAEAPDGSAHLRGAAGPGAAEAADAAAPAARTSPPFPVGRIAAGVCLLAGVALIWLRSRLRRRRRGC